MTPTAETRQILWWLCKCNPGLVAEVERKTRSLSSGRSKTRSAEKCLPREKARVDPPRVWLSWYCNLHVHVSTM